MTKPSVLVTFDSMKYRNSGYFSFGKGLGDALIKQNHNRFNLKYFMFRKTPYQFENKADILYLLRIYKLFFPYRNTFNLVHFSDQNRRLKPNNVNAKKIMTIHDMNKVHLMFKKPHHIKKYLKNMKNQINQCDNIVAISNFVANDILSYFPEVKDKLSVIYNGAEKPAAPSGHSPAFLPQKPFIFTIGLLSVQKGFHLLPALLRGNDFELVIAGVETPHKQMILEEARKYHCLNRVHITGPVTEDDKAWYYKNCSAFVFPSIAEGFGLPIIEAMHFGKPVFLSKFTSLPEVGGDAAYYFDNFEPESMQSIFAKGMKDFTERDRAEEVITQANKFTWERAASQYLNLYEECLK